MMCEVFSSMMWCLGLCFLVCIVVYSLVYFLLMMVRLVWIVLFSCGCVGWLILLS